MHNQMRGVPLIFFFPFSFSFLPRIPNHEANVQPPTQTDTHQKRAFQTWQEVCICVDMQQAAAESAAPHTAGTDQHRWSLSPFRLAKRTPGGAVEGREGGVSGGRSGQSTVHRCQRRRSRAHGRREQRLDRAGGSSWSGVGLQEEAEMERLGSE